MRESKGNSAVLMSLLTGDAIRYGEGLSDKGLVLIPLFTSKRAPFDYALLSQAIQSGAATIQEVGSGSVPMLRIVNTGEKPTLLVDGEHLIGVKQNRILNTTILVPEKSALDIPVSCVEQGRWSVPRAGAMPSSPHLFTSARTRKTESVTAAVRSTGLYAADQAGIWRDVGLRLLELKSHSATSAMDAIYEQRASDIGGYLKNLPWQEGQTGVVAATGSSATCCDLFDRPETLRVLWDRLISSYAVEAMAKQREGSVTVDAAIAFLWEASQATITAHPAVGRGTDLRLTSDRIVGAALEAEDTIVHLALFRREPIHTGVEFNAPSRRRRSRADTNFG